jgi:hypothetical protein
MTDTQIKKDSPLRAIEEAGTAYDPTTQMLDLTKDEKRRTTALLMAINAYQHLIIRDADYLREAHAQARQDGVTIRPATMEAIVDAAMAFDLFISGQLSGKTSEDETSSEPAAT